MEEIRQNLSLTLAFFSTATNYEEFKRKSASWKMSDTVNDMMKGIVEDEVVPIIFNTFPEQKGRKIFPQKIFTDDIDELCEPAYDLLQQMMNLGTTKKEVIEILVEYVKKMV